LIVDVDGTPLHLVVEGVGGPPVLLSQGMAEPWFDWDSVAASLISDHKVIRFDRPGLGDSPASGRLPTLTEEADRLAVLARWVGAPVTVVGHSVAGVHAEAFARRHPELVAGLVLVDPDVEPKARPRSVWRAAMARTVAAFGRRVGRLVDRTPLHRLGPLAWRAAVRLMGAPPPQTVAAQRVYSRGEAAAAALSEWLAFRDMMADLVKLRRTKPLPPVPLTVLSALGGLLPGTARRHRRRHAALARMSPRGRLVVLPDTGHLVPLERPEAIVAAVRAMTLD
jgi:pimeloyl-ACP methyl ester carboxylesterase